MTLQEKIDALPKRSKHAFYGMPSADHRSMLLGWQDQRDRAEAAEARLALAREWIVETPHQSHCGAGYNSSYACVCGRDALLKALEAK